MRTKVLWLVAIAVMAASVITNIRLTRDLMAMREATQVLCGRPGLVVTITATEPAADLSTANTSR